MKGRPPPVDRDDPGPGWPPVRVLAVVCLVALVGTTIYAVATIR